MTAAADSIVFRLPRSAYLAVLFLTFCVIPLALVGDSGEESSGIAVTWRLVLFVIPLTAIVFIARTATKVSASGITVRAAFGSTAVPWDEIRGLSVSDRSVYAVCTDGSLRLPCVRVSDLAAVARASAGRLPEIAEAKRKYAPSRRRR